MRVGYRHGDRRYPFLWEAADQPPARWHGAGAGPAQYLADTSDGAWAEFLRHEGIVDEDDLAGVRRRLWVVELPADIDDAASVAIDRAIAQGSLDSYAPCQQHADDLRAGGATAIVAPSAALVPGGARGQSVDGGLVDASDVDGVVWVLFGPRPGLRGWAAVDEGAPDERLIALVRPL